MTASSWHATDQQVRALLSNMAGRRVAVIGDVMLDAYVSGPLDRISPEAPVPVFEVDRQEYKLGGAANVAACLATLGADVKLCGVVGNDEDATHLFDQAAACRIDTSTLLADPDRPTTCKTRVVARKQQVLRLDRESRRPLSEDMQTRMAGQLADVIPWAEAVVLSDYSKGVLTEAVCRAAIESAGDRPVIVDPKKLPWTPFRGATIIKPNRVEAEQYVRGTLSDRAAVLDAGRRLCRELQSKHVLITCGADGMTLLSADETAYHWDACPRELVDVTGAGDVVAAGLAIAMAAGWEAHQAAWLANLAAGIKVGKFGAASVSPDEIHQATYSGQLSFADKVLSREAAATQAENWRRRGQRVVFTNGCFDLLHLGHVSYLERSRILGDRLIVGINSDASVRRLKGPARPLQPEHDRALILAALASVDAVVVFDESTPLELIRNIRPDVLTKGADYRTKESVVGWDLVESWGGQVVLVDLVAGRSTTRLVAPAA